MGSSRPHPHPPPHLTTTTRHHHITPTLHTHPSSPLCDRRPTPFLRDGRRPGLLQGNARQPHRVYVHKHPPSARCLQAYAFYETGTDLGSSKEVRGNPTEYFRRVGRGSSCGVGVRVGALRAEVVRDNNAGKWDLFLQYGERF